MKLTGAYWRCLNRACGKIETMHFRDLQRESRTCTCGSAMSKQPQSPVFTYLDFLREEPGEVVESTRKE